MNAPARIETPLAKLREPFAPNHISKLPKETKAQREAREKDRNLIVWNCPECGGYHHKNAVHLDYVGHAALTDRLLDTDIEWSWEPLACNDAGLPAFDQNGGLWIKLTVCGVTRLGYGAADGKRGGDAVKEIIGDALRNAAMRFGAALDLWHKGDLHLEDQTDGGGDNSGERTVSPAADTLRDQLEQSVAQEVHHDETAVQQTKRQNWGGRYPNKTALRKARTVHHAELERIGIEGTFDDLDAYLTSPEYQDYIAQTSEHFPLWLEGQIPPELAEQMPPEYVQTFVLETKVRDMIALRGNVAAEPVG